MTAPIVKLRLESHSVRAARFAEDTARLHWHDRAVWFLRQKRDKRQHEVPEWEELRAVAAQLKAHTVSRLGDYLEQFEANALKLGAAVHWAKDAQEHNQIVLRLLQQRGVKRLAKSKSMLTEECHLNPWLEEHGIEVVDTDLGERIVQFRREAPSHIVMPAIHLHKEEIGELFHDKLGTTAGASDPQYLVEAARHHLRAKFLAAEAGLTGVNFAIAETGGIVVCTNEGNADLGTALPPFHIASMGIEKVIPRASDLAVFLRLLARSATGQPITTYTSHHHGPRPGGELHIVIVDNGRSRILARDGYRRALSCIRCGACMNTCPVYRRSGGHSYGTPVPGPIGSVLSPHMDEARHASLPFASTLCGSCSDVCPVKIDLHEQLLRWRGDLAAKGFISPGKRLVGSLAGWVLSRPWAFGLFGRLMRGFLRRAPRALIYNRLNVWGRQRELPSIPSKSFHQQWKARQGRHGQP